MEHESSYYWPIMRRAIERLDAPDGRALRLEEIAAEINLSPAHFQRIFSRWAGISPKRFQQYLTLDLARRMLAERFTTLETAEAAGLSGTGRLHDLFLRWEAMTPGDYARRGAGLEIDWGWFDSPFGPALVMGTDRGICGLAFAAETGRDAAMADLAGRWPEARLAENPARLAAWAETIFDAESNDSPETPLLLIGAPFRIKVWEALLRIPTGHVTTYGEIARGIGSPRATRAVGTAVGRNPISLLIPCHRALRSTGALGGYHWGLPVKRAILAREAAQTGF